jgi:ATP-dependent Clp protease ATP-binding subunit ClpA
MGVTKQAAQKRFVPRTVADEAATPSSQYSRFTDRARRVVVLAQEHARRAAKSHVGVEHVLLGLLDVPEALAARAITSQGLSLEAVRDATIATLPPPSAVAEGHIPFTGTAKRLLQLTLREALMRGHNYIGTEHILLAMLGDAGSSPQRILRDAGVDRDEASAWIASQLSES